MSSFFVWFHVRSFVQFFCPISCPIFGPIFSSDFLFDFLSDFMSNFMSDFMSVFFVRFDVRSFVQFRSRLFCPIFGPIGCRKNCAHDNPERLHGISSIHCSWHSSRRTYFCCFPLALPNIRPWPLVPFFQISLNNSELKTTHNTFRNCRVHCLEIAVY